MQDFFSPELKQKIIFLADKYETKDFILSDPSQFMHNYSTVLDREAAAFIAAQFSFGRRDIFIPKLKWLFELAKPSLSEWIVSGKYKKDLPKTEKKFYRFYSYDDLKSLLDTLCSILEQGSLGDYVKAKYESCANKTPYTLVESLIQSFPDCKCVSQNSKSACKRLHMFLRWMVRQNSPVDLGIWKWANASDLIIPLDTHVLQESIKLGLLPYAEKRSSSQKGEKALPSASAKTAFALTQTLKQIWPDDPCRGDFALFGLGVDI